MINTTRPLRKLADDDVLRDDTAHGTAGYSSVHEDSSTASTKQDATSVEFQKRSTDVCSEKDLIDKYKAIAGLTFSQLLTELDLVVPNSPSSRKGFIGMAIELALGAKSGNKSQPDFNHLGIELKTLPLNHLGKTSESTFVTAIPLLTIHKQTWKTSQCFAKLKKVLWIPIEDDDKLSYMNRRIGEGILWSPSADDEKILANDWEELTFLIRTGQMDKINASLGEYLQIRPKGANSQALCYCYDEFGKKTKTMPRGFYLRSSFTTRILS